MRSKQQFQNSLFRTISCAATALITVFAVAAVPALAQNAVPPTARQAAADPAFASRLADQAAAQKAGKARRIVPSRRAHPSPQYGLLYDNGPYNGTTDAWTINFGFSTSDSYAGAGAVTGLHFVYWDASSSDLLTTVDISIGSTSFGGTPQTLTGVTNTFLGTNQYGYNLYQADYSFSSIGSGSYMTLSNACTTSGCSVSNPIYWDENSGIGCQSPGCPSTAYESNLGSIPSESFSLDGSGGCSTELPAVPRSVQAQAYGMTAPVSPSQTFRVLHDFTGGQDGGWPSTGVTIDQAGNLDGPSYTGGQNGYGNVYRLSRHGSDWILTVLYSFQGGSDGEVPEGALTIGPYGTLYGTTVIGGGTDCYAGMGCGTVYAVRPAANATASVLGGWKDKVLYGFTGGTDGSSPASDLVFDQVGNLYGATSNGGAYGRGAIYELMPTAGGWAYRIVYSFTGAGDGAKPIGNLMFDQSGNLYGAAYTGGRAGCGTIYQLTPSGSGWTENTLYTFRGQEDSGNPLGLVMDQVSNLYGVTIGAGCLVGKCQYGVGTGGVFMLSRSGRGWVYSRLYTYQGFNNGTSISIDASGNLYGTLARGGDPCACGEIFELAPGGGGWTYTDLHDFNGSDGSWPTGKVVVDANGNIYGVTNQGGSYGAGVVWEITP